MAINVLIRGAFGNVGGTLTSLLLDWSADLGIGTVFAHRHSAKSWRSHDTANLIGKGAVIVCDTRSDGCFSLGEVRSDVHYIFECASEGVGRREREFYSQFPALIAGCAQGSEKGYGLPFMVGVNDHVVQGQPRIQVVSCNTHGTAAILASLFGPSLSELVEADVVVVRRSEDLGAYKSPRLVGATVVSSHRFGAAGTHHAFDVVELFRTRGVDLKLTSSDATTPSQLLHAVRFNCRSTSPWSIQSIQANLGCSEFVAQTGAYDSNQVFEAGRRHSYQGRIYSHAIVVSNNLLIDGHTLRGWAFVPQEGASVLSTVQAFLLQTGHDAAPDVFRLIKGRLLRDWW